jgi:alkylated DNA repair dioxygenase AlkB
MQYSGPEHLTAVSAELCLVHANAYQISKTLKLWKEDIQSTVAGYTACTTEEWSLADDEVQIDQLTINRYPPGVGLAPHVDVHSAFEEPIASLSLGSSAVMEFRRKADKRPLLLPRRSLTIMTGESRYAWCASMAGRLLASEPCFQKWRVLLPSSSLL